MYALFILAVMTPQEAIEIARAHQHIKAARAREDRSTYQEQEATYALTSSRAEAPAPVADYATLYEQAVKENKPLIVLVKVNKPYTSPAYLYYTVDSFDVYNVPTVIVSKPQDGKLYKVATFPYYSDRVIDEALAKTIVTQPVPQSYTTPQPYLTTVCGPNGCHQVTRWR